MRGILFDLEPGLQLSGSTQDLADDKLSGFQLKQEMVFRIDEESHPGGFLPAQEFDRPILFSLHLERDGPFAYGIEQREFIVAGKIPPTVRILLPGGAQLAPGFNDGVRRYRSFEQIELLAG